MASEKMTVATDDGSLESLQMSPPKIRTPSILKSRTSTGLDVAVVGGKGSLSHQAMTMIFDGEEKLIVHEQGTFHEVYEKIATGQCHSGVVPIENTTMGPMPGMYDLMLSFPDIKIVGEHIVNENHCLCAQLGTKLEDVDQIVAHPWTTEQCGNFIRHFVRDSKTEIVQIRAKDTSAACKVALARPNTATIQQREMAETMGLEVLKEGISDDENNKTRFVLVSKEVFTLPPFEEMSTTVAFALHNDSGSMFKALAVFGLRNVNIRRMVTRPTSQAWGLLPDDVRMQWEYYLILDVSGCPAHNKNVAKAIEALDEFCVAKRVLGSYRVAQDRQMVARQRFNSVLDTMRGAW